MRLLSMLVLSAAAATAQSPLTTTFASNNGQSGNMFDVVALTDLTVKSFDVNVDAGTWDFEVYTLPSGQAYLPEVANAAAWTLVGSATGITSAGLNLPTQLPICANTFVPSGVTQAFYVTVTNGTSMNYTNGSTTGTLFASNADIEFYEGAGVAYPFASNFNPRVFNGNIYYDLGDTTAAGCFFPSPSSVTSVGSGCGGMVLDEGSFYEEFASLTSVDLSGMILTGTSNGTGYQMTLAAGAGFTVPVGATDLVAGDDVVIDTAGFGGTLGMFVGSNGWMAAGAGNSNQWSPSAALFLSNPAGGVYSWTDLQPNAAGSGLVYYDEPAVGVARVTFDAVFVWGTTDPTSFQITMDTNTGDFSIEWGVTATMSPQPTLVGRSPAGASADPGAIDISAAAGPDAFYEVFPAGMSDLVGMVVTGTSNGNGHDITVAPGAGFTVPVGAVDLGAGDDVVVDTAAFGGTLGMHVGSNGWMSLGGGNSNGWTPNITTFLNNPSTGVYCWTDLQPNAAASGKVYYSESGTVATATFDNVYGWGTTDLNKIQLTYDVSNGDFTIEIEAVGLGNPQDILVGYADGAGSLDPGASDISAAAPFSIVPPFVTSIDDVIIPDLSLVSVGNPIQGATAVAFDVTTDNIPASAAGHLGLLGLSNPNLDLTGLGLPGCFQYATGDVLDFIVLPGGSSSQTWTALTIPGGPVLFNGFEFHVQSVVFGTDLNTFLGLGALTSNGLTCVIGDV